MSDNLHLSVKLYFFITIAKTVKQKIQEEQSSDAFTNCLDMRSLLFFNCWYIIFNPLN